MNTDAWHTLETRLKRLHINEQDLTEHFVRSGGHGGQNVNKVSSCVILTHVPSGLMIRCEEERSQAQNRFLARKRLADKWEAMQNARAAQKKQAAEKMRRQKRKRNRKAKEIILKHKHHRSLIKQNRRAQHNEAQ